MIRASVVLLGLFTIGTGLLYPLAMVATGKVLFSDQAAGSLIRENGGVVGSRLLGKEFKDPRYFWSRPSATSPGPYHAASSSGSNFGPLSEELEKAKATRREQLIAADPEHKPEVPIDLVTASASGLDPHISPEGADYQAARIAHLRRLPVSDVQVLIKKHTMGRQWGVLGEPAVNVVSLNRALDGK